MKERSTRNVLKRLKRIEDVLNPAPLYNTITPELQEMYDKITGKGQNPKEQTEKNICTNVQKVEIPESQQPVKID